ncbi:MAG: class I SAM-dependent methyltransferase [Saprospiraceae bacterium]
MTNYLNKSYNWQTPEIVFVYDELPLWASVPGNLLLENIPYKKYQTVVDIGFGTGFPLLILARRLGSTCSIVGVDLWNDAIKKATKKATITDINNLKVLNNNAGEMDISTDSVDLIVSNLGINNFENPKAVIQECHRILKPKGSLFLSSNLIGTFQAFYEVFEQVLMDFDDDEVLEKLHQHIEHRATIPKIKQLFESQGFKAEKTIVKEYSMYYADGSAFLNDYFIIMGFLQSWKAIIPKGKQEKYFQQIENKLNELADENGCLELIVPICVLEFHVL